MMIAETEFRYEVEEHVAPFRDVLLGLFFVTVGMSLDLHVVWAHFGSCCCSCCCRRSASCCW